MEKTVIKVNIGCGPHGKKEWINLDYGVLPLLSKMPFLVYLLTKLKFLPQSYNRPWPSNPRLCDCRKRLPFKDKSVDFIFTSHFIEHLGRYQVIKLLKECRRVLKPQGVIRISIPDLRILTQKYLEKDLEFFKGMLVSDLPEANLKNIADLFVQHFYGFDSWVEPGFLKKIQNRFIRGHLWMYDFQSFSDILKEAGFSKIKRCEPGVGEVPDLDFLDIHRENSIFIEVSE